MSWEDGNKILAVWLKYKIWIQIETVAISSTAACGVVSEGSQDLLGHFVFCSRFLRWLIPCHLGRAFAEISEHTGLHIQKEILMLNGCCLCTYLSQYQLSFLTLGTHTHSAKVHQHLLWFSAKWRHHVKQPFWTALLSVTYIHCFCSTEYRAVYII